MSTTSKVARMAKLSAALPGVAIFSSVLSSAATPAFALGLCGPNGHRGPFGGCQFGGENQAFCPRQTGHVATPGPAGTRFCV
jgi:hypothetical protein